MNRTFLLMWVAFSALFAIAIGVIDVFADPYLVFGTPRIPGFNTRKSEVDTREGLAKVYQFDRTDPHAIIIGSSRVDIGLDAASPAWPAKYRPIYDFGIPGAGMQAMLMDVRYAIRVKAPKLIVISPEFESFLFRPNRPHVVREGPSDDELRLGLAPGGDQVHQMWQQRAKDYFDAAFSIDAAEDSILTLAANRAQKSMDLSPDGNLSDAGFLGDIAADGEYTIFQQKNEQMWKEYGTEPVPYYKSAGNPRISDLREILDLCSSRHIQIIVLIQPSHVDRLEGLYLLGLWDQYESWERDLATLVDHYRDRGASPILWDFTGFNSYTEEALPKPGDRHAALRWFWEPVHYRKQLGDLMLQRMFGHATTDFGEILTPRSIDAHLDSIRKARAQYRKSNPDELIRLRQEYEWALDKPSPN
jgi:hypothetical protein